MPFAHDSPWKRYATNLRGGKRHRRFRKLTCERLEDRRLLAGDLQVRFQFQDNGAPVDTLVVGRTYDLLVSVRDARATPSGVLQAYFDVSYNASLVSTPGAVVPGSAYALNAGGSTSTPGLIDEAGGVDSDRLPPTPANTELALFRTSVRADNPGSLQLTAGLSQFAPSQPYFFGEFNAVRLDQIEFLGGGISIVQQATPRVSISRLRDAAEQGPVSGAFSVNQAMATSVDTVVAYSVGGAAAAGQDYQTLSGSVRILAGQTSATINVPVIDDSLVETDETVIVTLTNITSGAPNVTLEPGQSQASLVIVDNDSAQLSVIRTADGREAGPTNGVFTVQQSAISSTPTTVAFVLSGTATSGSDYDPPPTTVTIPSGQTSVQVIIATRDDSLLEGPETVNLRLTSISSANPRITIHPTVNQATLTIEDNEASLVGIEKLNDAAEQGTAAGRFNVSLSRPSPTSTVLAYTVAGTATAGADYSALSGSITIAAGVTSGVINVNPANDTLVEGPETVVVRLSQITSGHAQVQLDPAKQEATLSIVDNDTAVVSIAVESNGSEQGPTHGAFRVTQSAASAQATEIRYTASGTATPGQDYQSLSGVVTIPPGALSATIPVVVLDDALVEGAETVVVSLDAIQSGSPGVAVSTSNRLATLTIVDNDVSQVTVERVNEGSEAGPTPASFLVRQPLATSTNTVIAYVVSGSATSGQDFVAPSGSVTIPAGQTSAAINIVVIDDAILEGPETITLRLTTITSGDPLLAISPDLNEATASIVDNDVALVSITGGSASESQNGSFTLRQSLAAPVDTVVRYVVSGTATPAADYVPLSGTATILAGQTSATIPVVIVDDSLEELDETIIVELVEILGGNSQAQIDAVAKSAAVTILDNDGFAVRIVKDRDGSEAGVAGRFLVQQSIATSMPTVVSYTVGGSATNGVDYSMLGGVITIPAGSLSVDLNVNVLNDLLAEGPESVRVRLTAITGGDSSLTIDDGAREAEIIIEDNESGLISVAARQDSVTEGGGNGAFLISQGGQSTTPTVIAYSISGSAAAGVDYQPLSGQATIPAGQTQVSIPVIVLNDAIVEGPEDIQVTLTSITSGSEALAIDPQNHQATLEIEDDDSSVVSLRLLQSGGESQGDIRFEVSMTLASSVDTTIAYSLGGTATAGDDYQVLPGQVVIPAGQLSAEVVALVIDDLLVEPDETINLALTGISQGLPQIAIHPFNNQATGTLADNDTALVSLELLSSGVEGDVNVAFRISLTQPSSSDTTITFAMSGTAQAGTDYTAPTTTQMVVAAGQTSSVLELATLQDGLLEGDETLVVRLLQVEGGPRVSLDEAKAEALAVIADAETGLISVEGSQDGQEPSVAGLFTIRQSGVTDQDTVVEYQVAGTAVAGEDYTALTGIVTIPAGADSAVISVAVLDDDEIEGTETIIITLTGVAAGDERLQLSPSSSTATISLLDDDSALLSIVADPSSLAEGAASGRFTVRQAGVAGLDTVVAYTIGGTAISGLDFEPLAGTVRIPAGSTSAEIPLNIIDDAIVEGPESLIVRLSQIVSASQQVEFDELAREAEITILDNDQATLAVVSSTQGREGGASATFAVELSRASSADTVARFVVAGSATENVDYLLPLKQVVIPAGQTQATIVVEIVDDKIVEGAEDLVLTLVAIESGNPGVTLDSQRLEATAAIADNDQGVLGFVQAASTAIELTGSHSVPVRLVIAGGGTLRDAVTLRVVAGGGASSAEPSDYRLDTPEIVFPAGSSDGAIQNIQLTLTKDSVQELSETLELRLEFVGGVSDAVAISGIAVHTVELSDDPQTASIAGRVWSDINNNGRVDANEALLPGVTIVLNGRDLLGRDVWAEVMTDNQGRYRFADLPAGVYQVSQSQPLAYIDGGEYLGTINGVANGQVGGDRFTDIQLGPGEAAENYQFTEGGPYARYINQRLFLTTTPAPTVVARQLIVQAELEHGNAARSGASTSQVASNVVSSDMARTSSAAIGGAQRITTGSSSSLFASAPVATNQLHAERANTIQRAAAPSLLRVGNSLRVTLASAADRVEFKPAGGADNPTTHVLTFASGLSWEFEAADVSDVYLVGVGDNDQLVLHDSPARETLVAQGDQVSLEAASGAYQVRATGFARVRAASWFGGGDSLSRLGLLDFVLETEGDWQPV